MFHRILETFFLAQVIVEKLIERAAQTRDKCFQSNKVETSQGRARAGVSSMRAEGVVKGDVGESACPFQDLPPKVFGLFRQWYRYLLLLLLGAILGE